MCGIAALYAYHPGPPPINQNELKNIIEQMQRRGPDGCGEWFSEDGRVALGHRRLSIIDLSEAGAQPMSELNGSVVITYNGEIYNFRSLKEELEQKGYHFRSDSDTEVLLKLYLEKGHEMVHDLRGMYAFAIWDDRKKGLFVARDPFGIKPLYYSDNGKSIKVASQVKALLAGGEIDTSPEPAGHVGFFLWGHVPEPYTLYKSIRSLPAGTAMWVDRNGPKIQNFFQINEEIRKSVSRVIESDAVLNIRELLLDSVKHHMVSDVPVGFFLSSGIDSSTLVALASEISNTKLHTVTLGFKEYCGTENDEVPLAEKVAKLYGTEHLTVWIDKEDFENEFDSFLDSMDQPTTDGLNTYFVSLAAKRAGLKVAISGLGGDELWGGYPSFGQIPKMVKYLKLFNQFPAFGKAFRQITYPIIRNLTSPKYAGLIEFGGSFGGAYHLRRGMFMPWELPAVMDAEMAEEGLKELKTLKRLEETIKGLDESYHKISTLETEWYMRNQLLRDSDWAGMAHSLEIRLPLVDAELFRSTVSFAASNSVGKKAMALTPARPLPQEIIDRQKTGFTTPVREWVANDDHLTVSQRGLRGWARNVMMRYERACTGQI